MGAWRCGSGLVVLAVGGSATAGLAAEGEVSAEVGVLPVVERLPDPFLLRDGGRVASVADWERRRAEIAADVQRYVYGEKPGRPEKVDAVFEGGELVVRCEEGGRSVSFPVRVRRPTAGDGPFPAVISVGRWLTLPEAVLDELGVAVVTLPNGLIAAQRGRGDRGKGLFYELYGSGHPAGSLMAWAWGVSRVIDALEETPEAGIDATRLAVTGCSRNGKGALVCGAFDERIVLTVPTESGAGGASSWRVADALDAAGGKVQTARQIVTENTWMAPAFEAFGGAVEELPVDQHSVVALCAPRAVLMTENTAFEWLGPEACYVTAAAAQGVWEALGAEERFGFVQQGHGDHCSFKAVDELRAFLTVFLLGGKAETGGLRSDGGFEAAVAEWVGWEVPVLE